MDSCISLGSNSSYSVSIADHVILEGGDEDSFHNSSREHVGHVASQSVSLERSAELIIELQVRC